MGNNDILESRIKKLEEQVAKKKAELIRAKGRISEKERKARTRKLIQIGGLAEIAGLLEADTGFLLGVLLSAAESSVDSPFWKSLKIRGDTVLDERETARKKAKES